MTKIKKFLKKHWFIIAILVLCIARFLFTYKLPSFYLHEMVHDDGLYVKLLKALTKGQYLGI